MKLYQEQKVYNYGKKGKIAQIIGAVVDVNFGSDLPEIYTALEVNNSGNKLILEVAQHLGENDVEQLRWTQQKVSSEVMKL